MTRPPMRFADIMGWPVIMLNTGWKEGYLVGNARGQKQCQNVGNECPSVTFFTSRTILLILLISCVGCPKFWQDVTAYKPLHTLF